MIDHHRFVRRLGAGTRRTARPPSHHRPAARWMAGLLAGMLAGAGLPLQAQTWAGGVSVFQTWSDPFNWQGLRLPVSSASTSITFAGMGGLAPVQNLATVFDLGALTFASGAGAFALSGNALRFAGAASTFTQNSANAVTLFNALQISTQLTVAGAGSATWNGALANGAGGTPVLVKNGSGQLTLGAAGSFSGQVLLNQGRLRLNNGLALQAAQLVLNTGATLDLAGLANAQLRLLTGSGALALGNTVLTLGGSTVETDLYSGNLSATSGGLVITGGSAGSVTRLSGVSSIDTLRVRDQGLQMNGGALTLGNASEGLAVGTGSTAGASARVDVTGGALLRAAGHTVEVDGGVDTRLRVTNVGSRLETGVQTLVGNHGTGALQVDDGGTVAAGIFLVIGADNGGNGTLQVGRSGTVTNNVGVLGLFTGSTGRATVSGLNASWIGSQLWLGGFSNVQGGGTGTLTVADGGLAMVSDSLTFGTSGSSITVNGGQVVAGRLVSRGALGSVVLQADGSGGPALILGTDSGTDSFAGTISGAGSLLKRGASTQVLAGTNSFTGGVTVQGGVLSMANSAASEYDVYGGARLQLVQRNLGAAVVNARSGGTVRYDSTTLYGGLLTGTGQHDITMVQRLVGTSVARGVSLAPSPSTELLGVSSAGQITNASDRVLLWASGSNTTGTLNVLGRTEVSNFTSGGVINVGAGGLLVNSGTDLLLSGGSRTTLGQATAHGGTLRLDDGTRLQLDGGLLVNNGTISGTVQINYGGLAKGAGQYGKVIVGDGGRFSPGNSPGTVHTGSTTWGAGGSYLVELAAASGQAGSQWDLWAIDGVLDIAAGTSANGRFTIELASLGAGGAAGALPGFDARRSWQWLVVDTTAGITGFDLSRLTLDTRGFLSDTADGHFALQVIGGDLYLNFAPVPEPAQWGMMLGGLAALGAARGWRRRHA